MEVGQTQILVDHAPLSIVRHVGLHVDFHPRTFFWAFRPSPPSVKWTWTVSAFSTNESSYIAMIKGLQPCVWSDPYYLAFKTTTPKRPVGRAGPYESLLCWNGGHGLG
jgi:hypothetical protein